MAGEFRGRFRSRSCGFFIIAFVLSSLMVLGYSSLAEGQNSPKASGALLAKAQSAGRVRVIVKLNASFRPEGHLSGPCAVTDQRAQIADMQNRLHTALAHHKIRGIKNFKYIPYTAIEVDSMGLHALMDNPLVASIREDIPVPPGLSDSVPLIRADLASTEGYTGSGWAAAILDTGVDKTHDFFAGGKVVDEACYSTNYVGGGYACSTLCPNHLTSQTGAGAGVNCDMTIDGGVCFHGTHVAGIAAGRSTLFGGTPIAGVAKEAAIISIQVFSKFTSGCSGASPCIMSWDSDQISALERVYALRTTYNVAAVNLSLGGETKYTSSASCDTDYSDYKDAIDNLRSVGIAVVISSGNEYYKDGISGPACISTAVSVGATTKADVEASYSNYHPTMLSLFAPGSSIASSYPGNLWAIASGTSMAAPHVTGAWAILKQRSPTASVTQILDNIKNTGTAVTLKAGDQAGGSVKRIDILAAMPPIPPSGLTASSSSTSSIDLSWSDNSSNETGFKIVRAASSGGPYSEIGTTCAGATAYTDSGLSQGTTYHYKVRAYNGTSDITYSNEAYTTTLAPPPSPASSGGGGGGGCFIATAAFGSPSERHVRVLRDFRDRFLLTNAPGRILVGLYYKTSPPIADVIRDSEILRSAVRVCLLPAIATAYTALRFGQLATIILAAGLLCAGILLVRFVQARRKRAQPCAGLDQ